MIDDDDFPPPTLVLDYSRPRAERLAVKRERFMRALESYELPHTLDPRTGLPVDASRDGGE